MKVISKRHLISSVAQRIKSAYFDSEWKQYAWNPRRRYEELMKLPKGATEEQVIAILGRKSWTELICDECGTDSQAVVIVGEPINWESHTAQICLDCLLQAARLFEQSGFLTKTGKGLWEERSNFFDV